MDDIDDLIKEIAVKNEVAVGRDDPIMILATVNEWLARKNAKDQEEVLNRWKSEMESVAHEWSENSKSMAERSLSAGVREGKSLIKEFAQSYSGDLTAATNKAIEEAVNRHVTSAIKQGRGASIMNMIAAGMTLIAAAIIVWSGAA